jgi:hypothetical protein
MAKESAPSAPLSPAEEANALEAIDAYERQRMSNLNAWGFALNAFITLILAIGVTIMSLSHPPGKIFLLIGQALILCSLFYIDQRRRYRYKKAIALLGRH